MRYVRTSEKEKVVKLLTRAFMSNNSVLHVVGRQSSIPHLMKYCLADSMARGLAFVNDDCTAVCLCQDNEKGGSMLVNMSRDLWFAMRVMRLDIKRINFALDREKTIARLREDTRYCHVHFLAVDPDFQGKGLGGALLDEVVEQAQASNKRVYLETSMPENIPFYERHGFSSYHCIRYNDSYDLVFLRTPATREPGKATYAGSTIG